MKWLRVTQVSNLSAGDVYNAEVEQLDIVIYYDGSNYYAFENRCPHQNLPLIDGEIENNEVVCPYHQAKFCLRTGASLEGPSPTGIATFPVKITDAEIFIGLEI